ncbi:MAG: hypothetical protein JWN99_3186 [Ilumatobacteraceae bacterium]|nr:hypothetical protein [Ilumatobacteraceae bacterium]
MTDTPVAAAPRLRVLGIRHHGPGSARAVRASLQAEPPDIVLIEGPSDGDGVASLAVDPEMSPPVAMLGYSLEHPERAVFHPFASFSPEWVALTWALDHDVPVRFIDLPVHNVLAPAAQDEQLQLHGAAQQSPSIDPLGQLADAAGYDDPERWWEDVVEHRQQSAAGSDADAPFAAIGEAMAALRQFADPSGLGIDAVERRREAHMRAGIRRAVTDGFMHVVVVCGAWHVPALITALAPGQAKADTPLLRGLAKVKSAVTWVPWTHRRLASATGYGAGVTSPGWYHHLYTHAGPDVIARWFAQAAQVLRAADHPASAADVVEATRLASALATLRLRPLAGLAEVDDAARAVLGSGGDAPMRLISNELVIGTQIGQVPSSTPMVPLARSLAAEQKRCRLKPEASKRQLELDLRKPLDLRRSELLHRTTLLGIPWGAEIEGRGSAGTFRETWQIRWDPEFEVRVIEASGLGTTLETATGASVVQRAQRAGSLGDLTVLLEQALLAGLQAVVPDVLAMVAQRSAVSAEVDRLMEALPALARTIRYGDVRNTDVSLLHQVVQGIVARVATGLAAACVGLDDDASAAMAGLIRDMQASLALLGDVEQLGRLQVALGELSERDRVHGLLQGLSTRLLADAGTIDADVTERRVSRSLSSGTAPSDSAAFVEGFLGQSGAVLVHDPLLLGVLDRWMATLSSDSFTDILPLLRRTFGAFEAAERRSIGQRVRTGDAPAAHRGEIELDPERVAAGLATVAQLLGISS